jgi:hypothetical protein
MANKKIEDFKNATHVCYNGYYHLIRFIEGKWYLALHNHRLGWIIKRVLEEKILEKAKVVSEKDWTFNKQSFPPYTPEQIKSFSKFKKAQLDNLVKTSK